MEDVALVGVAWPMLHQPCLLADHELTIGLIELPGAGVRVATVAHGVMRHMAPVRAVRLAREYEATEHADALKPVIDALLAAADGALLVAQPEGIA